MPFVPLVAALALVTKLVDFGKYLTARNINGAVTQLVAWGAGIGAFFLLSRTDFASGITIGDLSLSTLNGASLILVGMSVASVGSLAIDFKQARDNTDTAAKPALLPGTTTSPSDNPEIGGI